MRPICQTCAVQWGKQLWEGSCHCTGHVSLNFTPPRLDFHDPDWDWAPEVKEPVKEEKPRKTKSKR